MGDMLRIPPSSIEAEQAVLGGLMLIGNSIESVGDVLVEESFYRRDHRLIYRAMVELDHKKKPFDHVTLGEYFEAHGLADQIGGAGYLIELVSTTPSAANIRAYASIVAEKAVLRDVIEAGTEIVNRGFQPGGDSAETVVAESLTRLLAFKETTVRGGLEQVRAPMKLWWDYFKERNDTGNSITGLVTPWLHVNRATHGLHPGLIILAGRPSMGKSLAAQQLADFTALRGGRVAVFSVEMSKEENLQRSISRLANVPHDFLVAPANAEYADKHAEYMGYIRQAVDELLDIPLFIDDDAGMTSAQICARARRMHAKKPLALVIVDHLHDLKIKATTSAERSAAYGDACQDFKNLAKDLGIPVVVVAALNRDLTKRTSRRPTMADLSQSGQIESKADVIIFLHREDYYDTEDDQTHLQGIVEWIIEKGRNMRRGQTVYLDNEFGFMRMSDRSKPLPPKPEKGPKSRAMPPVVNDNFPR